MFHGWFKFQIKKLEDDRCGMSVEVFSTPVCSDGDDESVLLFLSSSITSSASGRLMLLGYDVAPPYIQFTYFLVQQFRFTFHGYVIIIIKSLNFFMVLPVKFKFR